MEQQSQLAPNCDTIHGYALSLNSVYKQIHTTTERGFEDLRNEQVWSREAAEYRQHLADDPIGDDQSRRQLEAAALIFEASATTMAQLRPGTVKILDALRDIETITWKAIDRHTQTHAEYGSCEPTIGDIQRAQLRRIRAHTAGFLGKLMRPFFGEKNS